MSDKLDKASRWATIVSGTFTVLEYLAKLLVVFAVVGLFVVLATPERKPRKTEQIFGEKK